MTKVMLPKEVAEAVKRISIHTPVGIQYDISTIAANARNTPESDYGTIWRWITREEGASYVHDYFSALVNGYEVEQTPEEQLVRLYKEDISDDIDEEFDKGYDAGYRRGMYTTLSILGITIAGINDKEAKQ